MDEKGIHTGSSWGIVEWGDIHGIRNDRMQGTQFLSVLVAEEEKYLARMSSLARKSARMHEGLGVATIALSFVGLTPGIDDAICYLQERGFEVENV